MTSPSPFAIGQQVGNNFNTSMRRVQDENAIDGILSQAMSSGDPAQLQKSIGAILSQVSPERQQVAVQFLQGRLADIESKQTKASQRAALQRANVDPDLPADLQKAQYEEMATQSRFRDITGRNQQPSSQQLPAEQRIPADQSVSGANVGQTPMVAGAQGGLPKVPQKTPTAQPQNIPLNPRDWTDDQIVLLRGVKGYSEIAKAEESRRQEERKLGQKEKQASREEVLGFHKESKEYDEDLMKKGRVAKTQIEAIKDIKKAVSSGNVKPTSLANIFKTFGKIGQALSDAVISGDEAALQASIPQLLEGWKDVFGVRLTDADLKVLQDKLPSIGKSPEANRAIVKVLEKYADLTLLRNQISKEIKSNNGGLRPLGYADMIEERFDQMISPVKIINPNNGNVIEIPAYQLSDAIKAGAKLADE